MRCKAEEMWFVSIEKQASRAAAAEIGRCIIKSLNALHITALFQTRTSEEHKMVVNVQKAVLKICIYNASCSNIREN